MPKEIEPDKWMQKADEIEKTATWLQEDEVVEVVYGDFEEVETSRTDKRTGNPFVTKDWRIGIRVADGSIGYRLIHRSVFVDLIKAFKAEAKGGKVPETIQYRRPRRRY